jgi:glycosyltransferase involved in cell wall biosynthesis
MKRLKVLISAYACNPVGSLQLHPGEDITGWRLVEQITRFHDVWVITDSCNREEVEKALDQKEMEGGNFCFVNLPSWLRLFYKVEFGQRIYYYLWQILGWNIAKKLHHRFNFDVFHHITFGNDWMPSFIGAFLQIPFIWGPLGGGQRTPKGLFKEYTMKGKIAELVRGMAQWIGRNILFSRKQCMERAKAILVCNDETKAKIEGRSLRKVYFFPVNGISKEDLSEAIDKHEANNSFIVLTAGRLHRLKGFDIAIRAFSVFAKEVDNVILEIVGQGPEKSNLRKLANGSEFADKIRFIPWLPRTELLRKMHETDVFLFPSFRDGGGAVVVEAMASGLPVICLDTGGPGFHIRDDWGIKIKPKSPEYVVNEMAKALKRLYFDRDLRERLGRAARKRAEEFYLWDRLGERLMNIYEKVLHNDRPRVL